MTAADHGAQTDNSMAEDGTSSQQQQHPFLGNEGASEGSANPDFPWVDTYINGEDLANLFRTSNTFAADDLSLTMEGMFSEYQPLFDFYQGTQEFSM